MNDAEKSKLEQELKKAAPVINRLGDGPSVLPDHVRARLEAALDKKFPLAGQQASEAAEQAPVRKTPLEQIRAEPSWLLAWRWWIGLTTATAAVVLLVVFSPALVNRSRPTIQFAKDDHLAELFMNRGLEDPHKPHPAWVDSEPLMLREGVSEWLADWPVWSLRPVVKVLYRYSEVVVHLKKVGRPVVIKAFPVADEKDLPKVLDAVNAYIEEQTGSKR